MTTNIIFPAPGAPNSYQLNDSFISTDIPNFGKLEIYYSPSYTEVDTPVYISSQYNVTYDVAKYYAFDDILITKIIKTPYITQTLYFRNVNEYGSILYRKNTDIKLTYLGTGYTKIVTVKESSAYSITFDLFDGLPVVNTSGLRLVNVVADKSFQSFVPSTSLKFPAPGSTSATRWTYDFNALNIPDGSSKLSWFDNINNETDTPFYLNGQINLKYNIVDWYIKESILLSSTIETPVDTQTLYFNNIINGGLRYRKNHNIKITYETTGFNATVQILSADASSITFNLVNGFPLVNQGALRIVLVTMDVYTRSIVQSETLLAKGVRLLNTTTARENLFSAEIPPNVRGVPFYTNRSFADVSKLPLPISLPLYSTPTITGDNNYAIISQTIDVATTNTNVANWYTFDSDIVTYNTSTILTKTVFFAAQSFIPFPTGSTVRIRTEQTSYSRIFTVILGTYNSVLLDHSEPFLTDGSFIDNFTSTVYKQSAVSTSTTPINARENLFYFNLSPGLRSERKEQVISDVSNIKLSLMSKAITKVVSDKSVIVSAAISTIKRAPLVTLETPALSSLPKSLFKVTEIYSNIKIGQMNKQIMQVKSVVALSIANFINPFKTTVASVPPITTLAGLTKLTKVTGVSSTISADKITRFNVVRSQLFDTPSSSTVSKQLFKLAENLNPTSLALMSKFRSSVVADKSVITISSAKLKNVIFDSNTQLLLSRIDQYTDQRSFAITEHDGSSKANYFFLNLDRGQYGVYYPKYGILNDVLSSNTLGATSELTPINLSTLIHKNGIPTGVGLLYKDNTLVATTNIITSDVITNYQNVAEDNKVYVTGQTLVYDIVSWYIYENQIINTSTPTPGVTQRLYFLNPYPVKIFYPNTLVKIEKTSIRFSSVVQVLDSSLNSITFETIVGFPADISNMSINGMSSPVYSRAFTAAQMLQYGILQQTTLPRENLLAVEMKPNLRGVPYSIGQYIASPSDKLSSNNLELFQDANVFGDFRTLVTGQTSDSLVVSSNILSWYTYEENIVKIPTITAPTKTLFFTLQISIPFATGSIVKLRSNLGSMNVTVLDGTRSSITFAQPVNPLGIDNLYIERITSSVYTQVSVSTTAPPISARENLYYSLIRPLNKGYVGLGSSSSTPLAGKLQTLTFRTLVGDRAKLAVNTTNMPVKVIAGDAISLKSGNMAKPIVKLTADKTITTSGNLSKAIVKLTSDRKYNSTEVATTTTIPVVIWGTDLVMISGTSGSSTIPSVSSWYEFDSNILLSSFNNGDYVTLYTQSILNIAGGDKIRLVQLVAGYDRIFTVVSYNRNSVTINNPYDLPSTSGMYFTWGRTSTKTSVTYTDPNSVPLITSIKQYRSNMFEVPSISLLSKQFTKLTNDTNVINSGSLAVRQLAILKGIPSYSISKSVSSTSSATEFVWDTTPFAVLGKSGSITDTPIWYAFEKNIISVTTTVSSTITLYLGNVNMVNTGTKIRILQPYAGFDRIVTVLSYTKDSITIDYIDNFPITGGMYILWGRTVPTSSVTYSSDDSIPVINKFKTLATQLLDTPVISFIPRLTAILKDAPVKITIDQAILQSVKVVSPEISYPSKSVVSTSSTTSTTWTSNVKVTGISGYITTPSVPLWYAFESNIIISSVSNVPTITLYFDPIVGNSFGTSIRVINQTVTYNRIFTVLSYTISSVTISNPFDLPRNVPLYFAWSRSSTSTSVTYSNNNQTSIISKFSTTASETSLVPGTSHVLMKSTVRGEPVLQTIKSGKLETFDNIGIIDNISVQATQSIENTIPVMGTTPTYTSNVAAWYAFESNILTLTKVAAPANITVYFMPSSYTIGSTITLVNFNTRHYKVVPVISSTFDSVTFAPYENFPGVPGLQIYVSTTLIYSTYSYSRFSKYVKISSSASTATVIAPVVGTTTNSVTFVKPNILLNTDVSSTVSVWIDDASPSVYSFWQQASVTYPAHDNYRKSLMLSSTSVPYIPFNKNTGLTSSLSNVGKVSTIMKLTSVQSYSSKTVSNITTTPSISWTTDKTYIIARSGISTNPSVSTWYIRDDLYNVLNVVNTTGNIITLYFNAIASTNFNKIRLIHLSSNFDKVIDIISSTSDSVTISLPANFPSISGMYLYFGISTVSESVTYTTTNVIPFITKIPTPSMLVFETPRISSAKINTVVRSDRSVLSLSNIKTFKSPANGNMIFESPSTGRTRFSVIVKADNTSVVLSNIKQFKTPSIGNSVFYTPSVSSVKLAMTVRADSTAVLGTSKVLQATKLLGEPAAISARRLETFSNIKGVVENLTPILLSTDTAILITGRTPAVYSTNVPVWYIYDNDLLPITTLPVPTNITLLFTNTTGITIGSSVTLVQYEIGYFKTVSVISSTATSITIQNDNIPESALYIYFGTTITIAPTNGPVFVSNTTATIFNSVTGVTTNIQIASTSTTLISTNISFVKSSAFNTSISGLSIYHSNLSYYPQQLVTVTNNIPTNSRENLMLGLMSPGLRRRSFEAASNNGPLKIDAGLLRNIFKVAGDVSYASRELKSTASSPLIKWSNLIPITGVQKDTADTVSWYIYDRDILPVSTSNPTNITLYIGSDVLTPLPNTFTFRLTDNLTYLQVVTVISNTSNTVTIVNPKNMPSIGNLYLQWSYTTTNTTVTYTDNTNTPAINTFKSSNYVAISVPSAESIKQQLFNLISDRNTLSSKDFIKKFSMTNSLVFNIPQISTTNINYRVKADVSKLTIDNIPYKSFRGDGLYTTKDYFTDQRSISTTQPPVSPLENLYYALLSPNKYGKNTIIDNRLNDIKYLESLGATESYRQNPDLFPILFPIGIVNLGLGIKTREEYVDVNINSNPYSLNNYYNVPTDISVQLFNEKALNVPVWYTYDADILTVITNIDGTTQTLTFINDPIFRKFYTGDIVKIEQADSGFSVTRTVLDSTTNTITVDFIPNYPTGAIKIINATSPVYSKAFTFANLAPLGLIKDPISPRENLFAAEFKPNTRGVPYAVEKFGDYSFQVKNERLEVFNDIRIPGDYRLPISMQSVDITTTLTNVPEWYINDLDILTYLTGVNEIKTLFFAEQPIVPYESGSTIKLSNNVFTGIFTVLVGTKSSVSIVPPTTIFGTDNLFIERSVASVYPTDYALPFNPRPSNARENLFYSRIVPLDKGNSYASGSAPTISIGNLKPDSLKLTTTASKVITGSTFLSLKVKGDTNTFGVSKVLTANRLTSIESYQSKEPAETSSSTSLVWQTNQIFITGMSGNSLAPNSIINWYVFEQDILPISVIDSTATYITLYFKPMPLSEIGSVIKLSSLNANYTRTMEVVSYTIDSITILNPFDLPNMSGLYFVWGKNITTTTVSFTNNNRSPRINMFKSKNTLVFESPNLSTLSKQLVKLSSDTNSYKVNTGVAYTVVRSDNGYLTKKPIVLGLASKGVPIKFNDITQILIDSRGRVDKFITSNYHTIMNGDGASTKKKETIQFWN